MKNNNVKRNLNIVHNVKQNIVEKCTQTVPPNEQTLGDKILPNVHVLKIILIFATVFFLKTNKLMIDIID
jgi:hypothetical protein